MPNAVSSDGRVDMAASIPRAPFERLDADAGGFAATQAQAVVAQPNLDRLAERGKADDL